MTAFIVVGSGPVVIEAENRDAAAQAAIWRYGINLQIWELGNTFDAQAMTVHTIRHIEKETA